MEDLRQPTRPQATGNMDVTRQTAYLSPAPQADPHAAGFSSGLSPAPHADPHAAGFSSGLSLAPHAGAGAAGSFHPDKFESAMILYLRFFICVLFLSAISFYQGICMKKSTHFFITWSLFYNLHVQNPIRKSSHNNQQAENTSLACFLPA